MQGDELVLGIKEAKTRKNVKNQVPVFRTLRCFLDEDVPICTFLFRKTCCFSDKVDSNGKGGPGSYADNKY